MARPAFAVDVQGASAVARALKHAAGEGMDDQLRETKRTVEAMVIGAATVLVPRRSGHLANTIRGLAEESNGLWPVVAAGAKGTVQYAGPIHFGWPTRGLHRASQDDFDATVRNVLTGGATEFGMKSLTKIRRRRGAVAAGRSRRGLARGGPIRPQPFLYDAADHRAADIGRAYEQAMDQLSRKTSTT